jgi:hypothetical protein
MQLYTIINIETGEETPMSVNEILAELNRDRSDGWQDYTARDWREGLEAFGYPMKLKQARR